MCAWCSRYAATPRSLTWSPTSPRYQGSSRSAATTAFDRQLTTDDNPGNQPHPARLQADHVPQLLRILSLLDVTQSPDDLAIPSSRTHQLKGDLAGPWSIWVNGNWRITFRFVESDVELVDYQDYH